MKNVILEILRQAHIRAALRELPDDVAIYFHALEPRHWTAFTEAMRRFADLGYRTVTPAEFINPETYERRLFVSFDDSYHSWYRALPLLERLGVTATFYVNTLPFRDVATPSQIWRYLSQVEHAGEQITLSRPELRAIHAAGHTIGCHSHSHQVLSRLEPERWGEEIEQSKRMLEDVIGAPVTDFAYPFGQRRHFSRALREYCVNVGFNTIATGIGGLQFETHIDPLAINRTSWKLDATLEDNIIDLRVDSRLYARLTGRSVVE